MPGGSISSITRTRITTAAAIRDLTGYTKTADATDAAIEALIDDAQALVIHEVAERAHGVPLFGGRDGSNTRYSLGWGEARRPKVILDADGDGTEVSDATVWLRTNNGADPPTYTEATISSVDEHHGIVTLASAPATSVDAVEFTGYILHSPLSQDRLKACVELYAAHLLDKRVRGPGAVPLSNPNVERKDPEGRSAEAANWYDLYRHEIKRIKQRRGGIAVTRDTGLPGKRRWPYVPPESL